MLLAALGLFTTTVSAQDLLVEQANPDKQMSVIDSISLRRMLLNESHLFPSQELYPEWLEHKKPGKVSFTEQAGSRAQGIVEEVPSIPGIPVAFLAF